MSTTLADPKMAKRNDAPVKVDVDVLAKARIAAATKGVSLAEYVSDVLLVAAEQDIEAFTKSRQAAPKPKGSK